MPTDISVPVSRTPILSPGHQSLDNINNLHATSTPLSSDGGSLARAFGSRFEHKLRGLMKSAGSEFSNIAKKKADLQTCHEQLQLETEKFQTAYQKVKQQCEQNFDASETGQELIKFRRGLREIEHDSAYLHGTPSYPSDVEAMRAKVDKLEKFKESEVSTMIKSHADADGWGKPLEQLATKIEQLQSEIARDEPTPENMLKKHEAMANQQMALQAGMTAVNNLQSMVTTVSQAQTAQIAAFMNQILDDIKAINELMKKGGRTMTDAIG